MFVNILKKVIKTIFWAAILWTTPFLIYFNTTLAVVFVSLVFLVITTRIYLTPSVVKWMSGKTMNSETFSHSSAGQFFTEATTTTGVATDQIALLNNFEIATITLASVIKTSLCTILLIMIKTHNNQSTKPNSGFHDHAPLLGYSQ